MSNFKINQQEIKKIINLKNFLITILILQLIGVFIFDVVKVNDREVGIITRFGKAVSSNQNWSLKIPWIDSHAVTYNTGIQSISVNANTTTSDQQTLQMKVNVQYRLDGSKGIEIYRLVKDQKYLDENIIPPFIQEAVKASTTKFTSTELLNNRDLVKSEIEQALTNRLKEYYSTVIAVNLENIDWSDAYDKAIEAKIIAQQETEKAKQTLEKTKVESEIKVTEAKAEAESTRIRGEAIKTNPETLDKAKIDKWNGVLPQVTGSNSNIINLENKK